MNATIGAALKKIVTRLLTEKKNRERLGCLILAVLCMFLLPTMAVQAVFVGADFATDSPEFRQSVVSGLSPETVAEAAQTGITLEALRAALAAAGLEDETTKAEVLAVLFLQDQREDPLFLPKLLGCFAQEQTDADLIARINSTFGTDIDAADFNRLMSLIHPEIVSLALSQLGNEGGEMFWSWYGFPGRVICSLYERQ